MNDNKKYQKSEKRKEMGWRELRKKQKKRRKIQNAEFFTSDEKTIEWKTQIRKKENKERGKKRREKELYRK